jgi:hypothetical protein
MHHTANFASATGAETPLALHGIGWELGDIAQNWDLERTRHDTLIDVDGYTSKMEMGRPHCSALMLSRKDGIV